MADVTETPIRVISLAPTIDTAHIVWGVAVAVVMVVCVVLYIRSVKKLNARRRNRFNQINKK